jgi:hypothetical protein
LGASQHLDLADVERAGDRAESGEIEIVDDKANGGVGRFSFVLRIFTHSTKLEITGA